ncbi:MAG TPA: hypothetical protein VH986_08420 [Acidimicrobiia bacterium]
MKGIAKQLAAALVTTFLALGLGIGTAGASGSEGGYEQGHQPKGLDVSQLGSQRSYIDQSGDSNATSWQFVPVNFNGSFPHGGGDTEPPVKPGVTDGYGKDGECRSSCDVRGDKPSNGGDVRQTNDGSATTYRQDKAFVGQFLFQDQDVSAPHTTGHPQPGCDAKCDNDKGDKDWKAEGPSKDGKVHQAASPDVSQRGRQSSWIDQSGDSNATSWQFLPINANFGSSPPGEAGAWNGKDGQDCGCSSRGKDGHPSGDVEQTNDGSATSIRTDSAKVVQVLGQDQDVSGSGGQTWQPGHDDCKCSDDKDGGYEDGHGPKGPSVSQDADQRSGIDQSGDSNAESWQVAPINVNAPIAVWSDGSNNGDVTQTNDGSATAIREDKAVVGQAAFQDQDVDHQPGDGGQVSQEGDQSSKIDQSGDSDAESHQILPINVNAPISIGSHGSNNGDVQQTNDGSATTYRSNQAGTFQGLGQVQSLT